MNLDSLEMTVKKNMMAAIRRLALVVVVSMLGFAVVPAATASATPSCYGSSCEGRDPAATNCVNDARTILSRNAVTPAGNWGNLELRYSPSCYTNWTAMTTAAGTTCSSVGVYYTEPSSSGQGERRSLGTYNAPCLS